MKQRGVTLIELLVALIVVAILATTAAPSWRALIDSHRRQDAAQQLASGLRMARAEAIVRGLPVMMLALDGDWRRGWSVFVDANRNRIRDESELTLAEHPGHLRVRIVGNARVGTGVGFESSGRLINNTNGTLAVCQADAPASHYQVVIAVTGRVSLRRDGFTTDPCT